MALKTFNLDEETYKQYSAHCKENGISMSKQVEKFITQEVARLKPSKQKEVNPSTPQRSSEDHSMSKFC